MVVFVDVALLWLEHEQEAHRKYFRLAVSCELNEQNFNA